MSAVSRLLQRNCGVVSILFPVLHALCGSLILLMVTMQNSYYSKERETSSITQSATFGGGCFWCTEAVFETLDGVKSVTAGYAGGRTPNPTYKQVCTGETGHAEVIQIGFDPDKISYEHLLEVFWQAHDPTTVDRQGADYGSQYRSIILYHDDAQRRTAEQSKQEASRRFRDPIVTEIVSLKKFYPAEDYHQDYYRKNPNAPYCVYTIRPKLQKLKNS